MLEMLFYFLAIMAGIGITGTVLGAFGGLMKLILNPILEKRGFYDNED